MLNNNIPSYKPNVEIHFNDNSSLKLKNGAEKKKQRQEVFRSGL